MSFDDLKQFNARVEVRLRRTKIEYAFVTVPIDETCLCNSWAMYRGLVARRCLRLPNAWEPIQMCFGRKRTNQSSKFIHGRRHPPVHDACKS